jgi:ureidoglycolate lyase
MPNRYPAGIPPGYEDANHLKQLRFPPFQSLEEDTFAPFGTVVEHKGSQRRRFLDLAFDLESEGGELKSWVTRIDSPISDGSQIDQLERHPFSDQVFVPLTPQRYLAIVCEAKGGGEPDLATMRGFVAGPHQGVIYRRNVWHAGMRVLDAPAEFFVQMKTMAIGEDDVFCPIEEIILLPSFSQWVMDKEHQG